ncbi:MAG: hypothetical protein Q9M24_05735 [Mariprofundaceae bacterium]|nr:hypothetical protein [Mariprofundaceae bacterium]
MMRILLMALLLTWGPSAWASNIPDSDSPGGKLFATHCSACHTLPSPKRLDWPHWRHMLGLMKQRMDERSVTEPSKEEWRQISGYLKAHAR